MELFQDVGQDLSDSNLSGTYIDPDLEDLLPLSNTTNALDEDDWLASSDRISYNSNNVVIVINANIKVVFCDCGKAYKMPWQPCSSNHDKKSRDPAKLHLLSETNNNEVCVSIPDEKKDLSRF